jgi:hypothetical protein
MMIKRSFQQDCQATKKMLVVDISSKTCRVTYQQGRLKTLELLHCWLSTATSQEQLFGLIASYLKQLSNAYQTFNCYGFMFDAAEIQAALDYLKGQIACYQLYQPRLEALLYGQY